MHFKLQKNKKLSLHLCPNFNVEHLELMIKYMWKIACTGMLFFGLLFGSCTDNDYNVGGHLIEPYTTMGMLDTITIKVSNLVESDSVITSGKGNGFSGVYCDPQIGRIEARTYIEFSRTSGNESNRYATFDSVTLVLRPNGNYFGDTVKHASFKVSKLLKPIEKRDDGYLYSTSQMPLGDDLDFYKDKTIKVKVKDTLNNVYEIKLDNEFGKWLFQGILRDEDDFKSDKFLKTFPGLSIGAGERSDCIHGFGFQDTCMIRIYYHVSTTYKQNKTMTFKANSYNSFYSMSNDKSNIKVPFDSKSDPVSSLKTDDMGYIMSGTPMYARLEFPYLNELQWLGKIVKIRKATLYVRPIQRTYDTIPLPPHLNIYYFDPTSNTPLSEAIKPPSMGGSNATAQDGNLPANYHALLSPDYPQYTFDVTDFVASQLGKRGYNKWALSLIIPRDSRENTLQRMVFGNQNYWYKNESQSKNNRIKLEITYVVYNE